MRIFEFERGEETEALAVEFDDGRCVVAWLGDRPSMTVYARVEDMVAVHGHGRRIWRRADIDMELVSALYDNHFQDLCENVYATLPHGNARWVADERSRLAAIFEVKEVG